jgi:hypothetical protein
VVADFGAHPELFVLAVVRVAFVLPLLLLVLEFAVIHDAANGRLLLWRDFNEVEPDFAGTRKGVDGFENTENFSFMSDNSDGRDADLFIDPLRLTIESYGKISYRVCDLSDAFCPWFVVSSSWQSMIDIEQQRTTDN